MKDGQSEHEMHEEARLRDDMRFDVPILTTTPAMETVPSHRYVESDRNRLYSKWLGYKVSVRDVLGIPW